MINCPDCGSTDIEKDFVEEVNRTGYACDIELVYTVECLNCGCEFDLVERQTSNYEYEITKHGVKED